MLYTIRWYRDSSLKNILILAVMIGCAMMAKVSAGLVAPAVAVVFLVKLWRERKSWKRYFGQFIPFGLVVFPPGAVGAAAQQDPVRRTAELCGKIKAGRSPVHRQYPGAAAVL